MTAPVKPFPDEEQLVIDGLLPLVQAVYPTARMVTTLPGTITVPTLRIKRISGASQGIVLDRPIVDIDVFWSDYGTSKAVARQAAASLLELRGVQLANGVITNVRAIQGPRWLPDPDPNLFRFNASYEVFTHG